MLRNAEMRYCKAIPWDVFLFSARKQFLTKLFVTKWIITWKPAECCQTAFSASRPCKLFPEILVFLLIHAHSVLFLARFCRWNKRSDLHFFFVLVLLIIGHLNHAVETQGRSWHALRWEFHYCRSWASPWLWYMWNISDRHHVLIAGNRVVIRYIPAW